MAAEDILEVGLGISILDDLLNGELDFDKYGNLAKELNPSITPQETFPGDGRIGSLAPLPSLPSESSTPLGFTPQGWVLIGIGLVGGAVGLALLRRK